MRLRLFLSMLVVSVVSTCGSSGGPATMEFLELKPAQPRIGDVVTVRFKLTDSRGMPLAGQEVRFELQTNNEAVTLNPQVATSLKGSGIAETYIQVNGRVTSLVVVATSGDKTVTSPAISVAGSVANGRQFTFQCGAVAGSASGGIHAIGAYDLNRVLIAGVKVDCTAHVADRNGDGVANALVSFMNEAGAIGPTQISMTDVVGNATILHKTSEPLPIDVPPGTFTWAPTRDAAHIGQLLAPMWMEPYAWVSDPLVSPHVAIPASTGDTRQEPSRPDPIRRNATGQLINNPRDNLVTMIAITSGEEGFSDDNNNGKYDDGEAFEDLPEPFVDNNDNGTWDDGERFIDADNNKEWSGANGKWDESTLIWAQERILWTGFPHPTYDSATVPPLVSRYDPPPGVGVRLLCPEPRFLGGPNPPCFQATLPDGGPEVYARFLVSDPWFNTIAQNGEGDGCAVVGVPDAIKTRLPPDDTAWVGIRDNYPMARHLGMLVRDARDPNATILEDGGSPVPKRENPVDWVAGLECTYTNSPKEGRKTTWPIGIVSGTIE